MNYAIKHNITGAYFDLVNREWVVGCTNECVGSYEDCRTIAELESLDNVKFEGVML